MQDFVHPKYHEGLLAGGSFFPVCSLPEYLDIEISRKTIYIVVNKKFRLFLVNPLAKWLMGAAE